MTEATDVETPVSEPETLEEEPTTFDREYVTRLREEAAQHRVAAKEAAERGDALAELLLARSVEQATAGILRDPSDLPFDESFVTDTGAPDLDAIRSAAEALTSTKPYLAAVAGDVSQGVRESAPAVQSLGDAIRAAL